MQLQIRADIVVEVLVVLMLLIVYLVISVAHLPFALIQVVPEILDFLLGILKGEINSMRDIKAWEVLLQTAVPLIYERVYDGIQTGSFIVALGA